MSSIKPTIYLDMDGVVADFNAYAEPIVGYKAPGGIRYDEDAWQKISRNPRLYSLLPKCPGADRLVETVKIIASDHDYDVKFLSAIPKENNLPWVYWDKIHWVQKYFPDIPLFLGPYSSDKQYHYSDGDILIDDRTSNVSEWTSKGGFAIMHYYGQVDSTLERLRIHINNI